MKGTGPSGRVVAKDILATLSANAPATGVVAASTPVTSVGPYEDVAVTPMRRSSVLVSPSQSKRFLIIT